jgi:hypothetical protein
MTTWLPRIQRAPPSSRQNASTTSIQANVGQVSRLRWSRSQSVAATTVPSATASTGSPNDGYDAGDRGRSPQPILAEAPDGCGCSTSTAYACP